MQRRRRGEGVEKALVDRSVLNPESGCIEWTAGHSTSGYGRVRIDGVQKQAHRVAWELKNGPIPHGLFVCHKCDNPPCINVEHLFLGTSTDNNRDTVQKGRHAKTAKTHCPRGHQYSADNTYIIPSSGGRACKICREEYARLFYAEHREERIAYQRAYSRANRNKILLQKKEKYALTRRPTTDDAEPTRDGVRDQRDTRESKEKK